MGADACDSNDEKRRLVSEMERSSGKTGRICHRTTQIRGLIGLPWFAKGLDKGIGTC